MENKSRLPDLLLEIRPSIFHSSIALGFLAMVILAAKPFQVLHFFRGDFPVLDFLTKFIFDVFVWQLASLIVLLVLFCKYFKHESCFTIWRVMAVVSTFFFLLICFQILAQEMFLKPSFHYSTPGSLANECYFTSYIMGKLAVGSEDGTAAPSGFAMRQVIILLCFLLLEHQKPWRQIVNRRQDWVYSLFFWGCFLLVCAVRVFRGRHSLFDVGIAIGLGVILFWFFAISASALFRRTDKERQLLVDLGAPLATYGIAVLFYCHLSYARCEELEGLLC